MSSFWKYSKKYPISQVYKKFNNHYKFIKKLKKKSMVEKKEFNKDPIYYKNEDHELFRRFKETIE